MNSYDRDQWITHGHDEDDYIAIGQRIDHRSEPEDNTMTDELKHVRKYGYTRNSERLRQHGTLN